jgi:hypothetical protein
MGRSWLASVPFSPTVLLEPASVSTTAHPPEPPIPSQLRECTSIQPTICELPYHVLETFRKPLHRLYAAIGAFWKQALGRGRSWVCNPGCFLERRLLQELELRCRHITWYKITAENPAAAAERDRLGSRYCWKSKTSPSKELSMTKTCSTLEFEGLLERKLKSSSRYLSLISA